MIHFIIFSNVPSYFHWYRRCSFALFDLNSLLNLSFFLQNEYKQNEIITQRDLMSTSYSAKSKAKLEHLLVKLADLADPHSQHLLATIETTTTTATSRSIMSSRKFAKKTSSEKQKKNILKSFKKSSISKEKTWNSLHKAIRYFKQLNCSSKYRLFSSSMSSSNCCCTCCCKLLSSRCLSNECDRCLVTIRHFTAKNFKYKMRHPTRSDYFIANFCLIIFLSTCAYLLFA